MDETEGWFRGLGPPDLCRAFITHYTSALDRKPILDYARFTYALVAEGIFPDRATTLEKALPGRIMSVLKGHDGFNPMTDYLVLAGDPIAISLSVLAVSTFAKSFAMLRYDTKSGRYWPFRVKGS